MTKKPLTEVAANAWHELATHHGDPFEIVKARIFAISSEGFTRTLIAGGDIYDALDQVTENSLAKDEIGIGAETCGWAAPVSEDEETAEKEKGIAPSDHPKRRRCRLVCVVNTNMEAGSALGFQDTPDEIITDDGKAVGSLADALLNAVRILAAKTN